MEKIVKRYLTIISKGKLKITNLFLQNGKNAGTVTLEPRDSNYSIDDFIKTHNNSKNRTNFLRFTTDKVSKLFGKWTGPIVFHEESIEDFVDMKSIDERTTNRNRNRKNGMKWRRRRRRRGQLHFKKANYGCFSIKKIILSLFFIIGSCLIVYFFVLK